MRESPDQEFLALQEALAGRYSLEREIGRGGMGIVYLAREVRLDRPVALKLLPPAYAAQPALRERFLREARTAARLSHPHIVPIHAVDEVDPFVFIVMAYVEGETLEQRIRARGPLPASAAARIVREVAWALGYAHAQGVVHRDIKPGNILLEAGSGRALVSDFGIAYVSGTPVPKGTAEVMGTAEYMSPEQASGGAVDGRSDLYALGAVGYYMLSGRLPFEGSTIAATLAKQITQFPAPLSSVAPEVPVSLAHAIDRCLAKDPAGRFADGEKLAEAISLTLERRREIPLALRRFTEQVQEASRSMFGLGAMGAVSLVSATLFALDVLGASHGAAIIQAIVGLLFAGTPVAMLVHMIRRLLRSGHSHDELLRALRTELEEQREALAFEQAAPPSWWDRLLGRVAVGSLIINLAGVAYMWFGRYVPGLASVVLPLTLLASIGFTGAGVYLGAKNVLRGQPPSQRWLKFWDSRVGRALFKLAASRLERLPSGDASYRPTELAIGMAADRLFDELPAELQVSFSELPAVVRALERHAEQVRARIAELNEILHDVEHGGRLNRGGALAVSGGITEKHDSLIDEVRDARDDAEQRLAEVVGALETIRLQLLRMHAGIGSVESMTADLGSARELSGEIEHLVEAARQVDELLGLGKNSVVGDTPVPA
jgi:predicted Ser/Thr protein kinase